MEITDIANRLFRDRHKWSEVTDDDKIKWFFIFNRYTSKKYPEVSQLFNQKSIDKVLAFDLLFQFYKTKPYPSWFWSKSKIEKDDSTFKESDFKLLKQKYNITDNDLKMLINYFPTEVKEDLNWYKKMEKEK